MESTYTLPSTNPCLGLTGGAHLPDIMKGPADKMVFEMEHNSNKTECANEQPNAFRSEASSSPNNNAEDSPGLNNKIKTYC